MSLGFQVEAPAFKWGSAGGSPRIHAGDPPRRTSGRAIKRARNKNCGFSRGPCSERSKVHLQMRGLRVLARKENPPLTNCPPRWTFSREKHQGPGVRRTHESHIYPARGPGAEHRAINHKEHSIAGSASSSRTDEVKKVRISWGANVITKPTFISHRAKARG